MHVLSWLSPFYPVQALLIKEWSQPLLKWVSHQLIKTVPHRHGQRPATQATVDSVKMVNTAHFRNCGWNAEGESQVVTGGSSALTIQGRRVTTSYGCVLLARCRPQWQHCGSG